MSDAWISVYLLFVALGAHFEEGLVAVELFAVDAEHVFGFFVYLFFLFNVHVVSIITKLSDVEC